MSGPDDGDRLVAEELRSSLEDCWIGNQLVVVEEASSTNDLVWEAETKGAAEGLVVFAERQTAGRGRYGRRWESPPRQGLWFSVLLRPALTMNESPQLTSLLAHIAGRVIKTETGCPVFIKTPNDLFIGSRKIAGVLVEGRNSSDGSYVAVAGLGINVNQRLEDFPEELRETAGSLRMALGHQMPRAPLAAALIRNLDMEYRSWRAESAA